ncbi:MAG: histidine kinase dimerization/phospho-acceptor domain-containing protein, partial [Candidatus Aminicenantales bacterium]
GTSALLVGPAAGTNSVVLRSSAAWIATAFAPWLHLSTANQSGTGSTNVVFSYDANTGATRTGTLTIAGLTLTVTQAGSTYVAAQPYTTIVSTGANFYVGGMAVDGSGNVYITDQSPYALSEWTPSNNTLTTLMSSGFNSPSSVAVDGMGIKIPADIQFVFWTKSPGRPISLEVRQKDGTVSSEAGRIAVHDGGAAPFVDLFIALFSWGLGFAAVLYKKNDRLVRIFFWLCTAFGFSVAVQGETYVLGTAWTTLGPGLGYIALTALGPAFLLHFSLRFPGWTHSRGLFLLYIPPVMLAGFFSSLLAFAYIKASIGAFNFFEGAYFFLRLYMIVYFAAAVLHLARIGRRVQNDDLKAQVQWVFFGLIAGMSPFLLFYELPKALLGRAILSESGTAVFFLIIPAALAIAIIKHRLFDVEVVINRSLVYSLLTISTAGLYLLVVLVLQKLFSSDRTLFSVIAVFAAAAAVHPAQLRIQNLVDRAFFRQKYDYRQAVLAFVRQAQLAAGRADLLDLFLSALRAVLAPEKAGIFVHGQPKGKVVDSRDGTVHCGDDFDESIFSGSSCRLGPFWARRNAVRSGDDVSFAREAALAGDGLELALPLALPGAEICGWLALGRKRSGERFSREDLSLLRTLAGELMTNLDRIRLQEEVIYERASKEKLDEINRQKTEFISTVSHELRTPMASIQGIAELLQSGKIRAGEQREKFLALMVSESGRLSRFLHNVLDFGRIEQEVKSYRLSPIVVQDVVRDAVESFGLLLDSQGASIRIKAPAEPVVIEPGGTKTSRSKF